MFSSALRRINFTQTIQATRPEQVFLVRGKDTSGQRAWYYVLIDRNKRDAFKTKDGVPLLKLTDYGEILHSGFGDNPPESVKKEMFDEYGFKE